MTPAPDAPKPEMSQEMRKMVRDLTEAKALVDPMAELYTALRTKGIDPQDSAALVIGLVQELLRR